MRDVSCESPEFLEGSAGGNLSNKPVAPGRGRDFRLRGNDRSGGKNRLPQVAVFLTLAIFAQLGALGDTITLLDEVYVKGPKLLLSDVASISGENAALLSVVELAPAAAPGAVKRLDAAFIQSRVKSAGLADEQIEVVGARQVMATTMYLDISRAMIAEELRRHIEVEMPWPLDDAMIEVAPPPQDYVVPDGVVEFRWRRNPEYAYVGLGSFRGELIVDGSVERVFHVRANVQAYGDVVVAATDLRRGDPLSGRNLRLEKRELSGVETGAFFRIEELSGFLAKSSLLEGQPVTNRKVMPPTLVERNAVVVVETTVGAMTIQTRAKAQEDGALGDLVRCVNLNSKDEFVGRVRNDGAIVVE